MDLKTSRKEEQLTMSSIQPDWQPLISMIAAMVTLAPEHVVVQVHSADGPNGGPYVQTLCEEDGAMTLEAASNVFLDQKLSDEAIELLRSMGWSDPEPGIGLPNHHCMVPVDSAAPRRHRRISGSNPPGRLWRDYFGGV